MKPRTIISIGGQAFAKPGQKPLLEQYILDQTGARKPKIAFLPTASGDSSQYIDLFESTFARLRCTPLTVPLFRRTPHLEKVLLSQDAIFVGGGNAKSMLAVWRDWGVDRILKKAWAQGIVLAGTSAGAICWFEEGVTDSWDDDLYTLPCLGLLPGSCCPHYSGEKDRRPSYHRLLVSREIGDGIALDDGAAAHYRGRTLYAVVGRKGAHAYMVRRAKNGVVETEIEPA